MRVGELAKKLDLNTQTIRYYERIGLLPEPERTESGYRAYGEADERRLRFVKSARNSGLSLGEVKEVLALRERGEAPCSYVTETIARRAGEVERQIAELKRFKRDLDRLYEQARKRPARESGSQGYCHILEDGKNPRRAHVCEDAAPSDD
ncbi:MAG: heavy metal-responsive transcriptional regulator [Rubrobacteraceae bacterium]